MVTLGNEVIYVLCTYKPHSDSIGNFSCVLADILSSDKLCNKNCIVLGDLNVNILDSSSEVHNFLNLMQSHYFVSMINKPTRFPTIENVVSTLLDHVWTNKLSVLDSGLVEVDFIKHCPAYCWIPIAVTNCEPDCRRVRTHSRDRSESNMLIF